MKAKSKEKERAKKADLRKLASLAPPCGSIIRAMLPGDASFLGLPNNMFTPNDDAIVESKIREIMALPTNPLHKAELDVILGGDDGLTRRETQRLVPIVIHDLVCQLVEIDDSVREFDWPWQELISVVRSFTDRANEYLTGNPKLETLTTDPRSLSKRIIGALKGPCTFDLKEDAQLEKVMDSIFCPLHSVRGGTYVRKVGTTYKVHGLRLKCFDRTEENLRLRVMKKGHDVLDKHLSKFEGDFRGLCFCSVSTCSLPHAPFDVPKPNQPQPHNPLITMASFEHKKQVTMCESKQREMKSDILSPALISAEVQPESPLTPLTPLTGAVVELARATKLFSAVYAAGDPARICLSAQIQAMGQFVRSVVNSKRTG